MEDDFIPVHGSKSGCCLHQTLLLNQSQLRSSSGGLLYIDCTVLPSYVLYCTYSCRQRLATAVLPQLSIIKPYCAVVCIFM